MLFIFSLGLVQFYENIAEILYSAYFCPNLSFFNLNSDLHALCFHGVDLHLQ